MDKIMIYPSVGNLPVPVPRWIGRGLIHTGAPKHGMLVYRSASRRGERRGEGQGEWGKKRRRRLRRGRGGGKSIGAVGGRWWQ